MSHVWTVVLVITACWFGAALTAGVVLGTFMRRARALALIREHQAGPVVPVTVRVDNRRLPIR